MTIGDQTLLAVLHRRAATSPAKVAVRHVGLSMAEQQVTYAGLLERATALAGALQAAGVGRGDRVVLMLPTSIEFVVCLYGILLAGGVPTPVYPPTNVRRLEAYLGTLAGILREAEPALLVVPDELAAAAASVPEALRTARTFAALAHDARPPAPVEVDGADLALVQYSSGSTGAPKGVGLTHANLLANLRGIGERFAFSADDVGVCWLPLYHDMGLIGFVMGGLVTGPEIVLISPAEFLFRPSCWLDVLSRYRGTISGGPQFGYSLAADRVRAPDVEGLDLSRVRLLLVGAEPVVPDALRRFAARFAALGLSAGTLVPCYGLAENSLAVSFASPRPDGPPTLRVSRAALTAAAPAACPPRGPGDAIELASCGRPIGGTEIRVLRADGAPAAPGEVGELWVRGTSACRRIFGRPDLHGTLFDGPWVRTGDLGFVLDGDLYVTGRCKDLIIVAGRNFHPQDLEQALAPLRGLRPGRIAAIGTPHDARGTERITIVAEVAATAEPAVVRALPAAIRRTLATTFGVEAAEVALVAKSEIPVTSSGKLRRQALRDALLEGRLARHGES